MRDVLLGAAALVLLATTHAEIRNHFSAQPVPLLQAYRRPLPAGVHALDLATARTLLGRPFVVFVDAREPERFAVGHIREAVNLPLATLEQATVPPRVREAATVTIVYCDGPECGAAERVAAWLKERGATDVRVLTEGWGSW